jgi:hypothetical protein
VYSTNRTLSNTAHKRGIDDVNRVLLPWISFSGSPSPPSSFFFDYTILKWVIFSYDYPSNDAARNEVLLGGYEEKERVARREIERKKSVVCVSCYTIRYDALRQGL